MNEKIIDLGDGVVIAIVAVGMEPPAISNQVIVDAEIRLKAVFGGTLHEDLISELIFRDKCAPICGSELLPNWGDSCGSELTPYRMKFSRFSSENWLSASKEAEAWALNEVAPLLKAIANRKAAFEAAGSWIVE